MRHWAKQLLCNRVGGAVYAFKFKAIGWYFKISYSQEAEDVILARMIGCQPDGFYVDVGAHHPFRFSNTFAFYQMGWRGINIDANPDAIRLFNKYRRDDINICMGISDHEGSAVLQRYQDGAWNTLDGETASNRINESGLALDEIVVQVTRLDSVLGRHIRSGKAIDFLSVDVEGHDLQVLRSNDWERFRPKYVLAEILGADLETGICSAVYRYMREMGYRGIAKTFNTVFFKDCRG